MSGFLQRKNNMSQSAIVQSDCRMIADRLGGHEATLAGKTIVVSGGCGFLGRYIVGGLLALNKKFKDPLKIIALDTYITSLKSNFIFDETDPYFEIREFDVRNAVPDDIQADYIIHAAGLASPFYYRKYPMETIEVAVQGTKNFLEYARKHPVQSILFFSSSEIYGDPPPQLIPTPETYWGNISCLGPRACYDESKRLGETLCSVYAQQYGVPVKIVRPFNVYGPGGLADQDFRVIPAFISLALSGRKMLVHGKGNQTRTFCYVTDAVIGFLKVLLKGKNGDAYNIGHDQDEMNMMSLAHLVAELITGNAGAQLIDYPDTYPAGEPQRRCPDLSKALAELGYEPTINLREGLLRTIQWYKEFSL